jgi:hypothetical protein
LIARLSPIPGHSLMLLALRYLGLALGAFALWRLALEFG